MDERSGSTRIPARNAINTLARQMRDAAKWGPTHWTARLFLLLQAGRLTPDLAHAELVDAMGAQTIVRLLRHDRIRLGKKVTTFDVLQMHAGTIMPRDDAAMERDDFEPKRIGEGNEVFQIWREVIDIRQREKTHMSAFTGIIIGRHAVERLYDRERLRHDEIGGRLLEDVGDLVATMCFAKAAGLMHHGTANRSPYDGYAPGAVGMVPFGDGLMITGNRSLIVTETAKRWVSKRDGYRDVKAAVHPKEILPTRQVEGGEIFGRLTTMGLTYLSRDLLRPEQVRYITLFREAMVGHDIDAIVDQAGRGYMPHERPQEVITVEVDEELHRILRRNVSIHDGADEWIVFRDEVQSVEVAEEWYATHVRK